jgi:gliding motility-associated-like protein/uncharacterized repeat protein (TIGR01451 family)
MVGLTITGNPIATLAVGASNATIKGTYTITQADIDAGKVVNTALATAQDPKGNDVTDISGTTVTNDTPTDTPLNQTPSIALVKTNNIVIGENGCATLKVGDVVTYTFKVNNPGNVTLNNVAVTDPHSGLSAVAFQSGDANVNNLLEVTETWIYTATYSVTQADIDAGSISNQASVAGFAPNETKVTDLSGNGATTDDENIIPICKVPSITVTKDGTYVDTNKDGITNIGDTIVYNFVVTNTGNAILTNIIISDPIITILGGPITLAASASDATSFSGSYAIAQTDINAGVVYNLAIVKGNPATGDPVSNSSTDPTPCTTCPINPECPTCTITPLTQSPALDVTKTATVTSNGVTTNVYSFVGDIINYTILVKNSGNITIYQIVVTDPLTGLNTTIASLAPGASYPAFNETYTIIQSDLLNDSVLNVATANGTLPDGSTINGSGTVVVEKATVLACGTVIVHNAFSPNGDGINELFNIDNLEDTICYPENTVEIYNRWGVLVFETKGYNNTTNAFDGTSRGRTTVSQSSGLPTGTYFYILNYTSVDGTGQIQTNKKDGYLYLTK